MHKNYTYTLSNPPLKQLNNNNNNNNKYSGVTLAELEISHFITKKGLVSLPIWNESYYKWKLFIPETDRSISERATSCPFQNGTFQNFFISKYYLSKIFQFFQTAWNTKNALCLHLYIFPQMCLEWPKTSWKTVTAHFQLKWQWNLFQFLRGYKNILNIVQLMNKNCFSAVK